MKFSISLAPIYLSVLLLLSLQYLVTCDSSCDDNSKLQYEVGKSYVYKLEQVAYKGRTSTIRTGGKVVLTKLEKCDFVLTLQDVSLTVAGEKREAFSESRAVPRTSVKFSFRNGDISNLETEGDGYPWTENIVRGILTMLQNKAIGNSEGAPVERETNIKGDCLARVYIPTEGTYKKIIHNHECSDNVITESVGIPYEAPTPPHPHHHHEHMSILKCIETVVNGLISKANCSSFDALPFHHLAEFQSSLELEQAGQEPAEVGGVSLDEATKISKPISIMYDSSVNLPDSQWEESAVQEILLLTQLMYSDHDSNRAELYTDLKLRMGMIRDFEGLETRLSEAYQGNSLLNQFSINVVRDAASETRTEAALLYTSKLIQKEELTKDSETAFFTHLHLHKNATLQGIQALHLLVSDALGNFQNESFLAAFKFDEKKRIRHLLLGVSSYAHTFCRRESCTSQQDYLEMVSKMAKFCESRDIRVAPAAFHALGNLNVLSPEAVNIIKEILTSDGILAKNLLEKKKLTAFEAFRRDPCQPDLKKVARSILEDREGMSTDMRIAAYLAVARCVEEADLTTIHSVFETEPESALSSFIASHVYNVLDSQSPSKNFLKESLLSQIGVPESVPTVHNQSKASKYLELSTFHPEKNKGFSLDWYTIFGETKRKMPTFAFLNVTLDVHGKSYNALQFGLSWRYIPDFQEYSFLHRRMSTGMLEWAPYIIPAFFALDSFVRKDGTTISMASDIRDCLKSHSFIVDREELEEPHLLSLDMVKPSTIMDHELSIPTLVGLPFTLSLEAASLPMISMNHTGNPDALGIWDWIMRWDDIFQHNSTSDSALMARLSVDLGKGTPARLGHAIVAKLHCNHSIGYASSQLESGAFEKRIQFPENIFWSKRATFYTEVYGEMHGKQLGKWSTLDDTLSRPLEPMFNFEGMGIRWSGVSVNDNGALDIMVKAEKAEEQFSGYSMEFNSTYPTEYAKSYDLKFKTIGLSSKDALEIKVDYSDKSETHLEGPDDPPKFKVSVSSIFSRHGAAPSGIGWEYSSVGEPRSQIDVTYDLPHRGSHGLLYGPTFGLLSRASYQFKMDHIGENGGENELFVVKLDNHKDNLTFAMNFDGPLKESFGTVQAHLIIPERNPEQDIRSIRSTDRPNITIFSTEIRQESSIFGRNRMSSELIDVDYDYDLKASVDLNKDIHNLAMFISPRSVYENMEGEKIVSSGEKQKYELTYKNSYGREDSFIANYDEGRMNHEDDHFLRNIGLISFKSTEAPHPFTLEVVFENQYDGENNPKKFMFDAIAQGFGKMLLDMNFLQQFFYEVKEGDDCTTGETWYVNEAQLNCRTNTDEFAMRVAEEFELGYKYSNVGPNEITFDFGVHHHKSGMEGNFSWALATPEKNTVGITTEILIDNIPREGIHWNIKTNSEVDTTKRTWEMNSTTKGEESGDVRTWTTTGTGAWPDNIFSGESRMNFIQTSPENLLTNVNILNAATSSKDDTQDVGVFSNNLTVLIDHSSTTESKKFVWLLSSDGSLTDDEKTKLDYVIQMNNDLHLTILGGPESKEMEIVRLMDYFKTSKSKDREHWSFMGWSNVRFMGKEKAAASHDGTIDLSYQEQATSTEVYDDLGQKQAKVKFIWNLDGWCEQDGPSLRNNTIHYSYFSELSPQEIRHKEGTHLIFKSNDIAFGSEVFSTKLDSRADTFFQDLTHFSRASEAKMSVNNAITSFESNIKVNGPQIAFLLKSDREDDSWLVDVAGGIHEEKHQHKFNFRSNSYPTRENPHHEHHPHYYNYHHHHHNDMIPYTNFNVTISR